MQSLPSPAIILEWETVRDGGLCRGQTVLRGVCNQLRQLTLALDRPAEVIICYESAVISEPDLKSILEHAATPGVWPCPVLLSEVPHSTSYYEKKNIGARLANNGILLFLDTDLIPDPGWLEGMLTPFLDWEVPVVVGGAYLDHASLYEMAVALFWIFEQALPPLPLHPTASLLSNNLAVRRPLFLQFFFPTRPLYRGQCTELGLQFTQAGLTMYKQAGARASHPPPPVGKFVWRAWQSGRSSHYYDALQGKSSVARNWDITRTDYQNVSQRIKERGVDLNPSMAASILARFLGSIFYAIKAASYLTAHLQIRFLSVVPSRD